MLKKHQTASEFLILAGVVIFFFTVFFMAVNENLSDKLRQKQTNSAKEVALTVQDEINLAFESIDGYYREFKIPEDINGIDFNISITEGLIYLVTDNGRDAIALQTAEVTGQPIKGINIIKKVGGIIYLNP